jgi:CRP/FNR family transcriptional regulator
MFILLDGKVELAKRGEKGQTIVKTVAKPMEFFGEMAVIDGRTRSATATALAETRLAAVDRAAFEALFETNATFAARVVKTLSTRIRNSNENLTEIIDTPPKERILRAIVDYAEQFGEGFVQGARYVEMPALRVWLNGHIGVAPEEVDAAVFQCVKADELARVGEDEQTLLVPIPVIKVYERRVSDPAL